MNDKLAGLARDRSAPRAIFIRVAATVFLITLIIATAVTFILPESYASTCKIKVAKDQPGAPNATNPAEAYDPYFIETQMELIHSELVLSNVIAALNLHQTWGQKYFNGETLKTSEAVKILNRRMELAPVGNTQLIAITIYSDDRNEAAQMANAVADKYSSYRQSKFLADHAGLDPRIPRTSLVQITDRAEPGRFPVKPNKTLNIVFGAVAGIFLGLVAGGASALVAAGWGNRATKSVSSV